MEWKLHDFESFDIFSLYAVLRLRSEVFVVEQNSPYQDLDEKDKKAIHLTGYEQDTPIAYCRILPPGISYPEASIGRVVVRKSARERRLGKELMYKAIAHAEAVFQTKTIRISAQLYLKNFYENLGFIIVGNEYMEDSIPHIEMLRKREE